MAERVRAEAGPAAGVCWSAEETARALEQAHAAPIPARTVEDWRRTDPGAFPWERLRASGVRCGARDIRMRTLGRGEATGLVPLEADCGESCHALHQIAGDDYDAKFLYYHKALSHMPACFRVPRGFRGDPVELLQRATGAAIATFTSVFVIEAGAELTLFDSWEAPQQGVAAIGRTEIVVGENARLVYLQEDGTGEQGYLYRHSRIRLAEGAKLLWCAATPGASWHAARLEIMLDGAGSEAVFKGLYAGSGESRADHRTHQYHGAPRARSELTFKTLLSGRAHSVYQGLITVPQPAQKTDAYQQCRNLLLEPGTHADAIPKLEIMADDVRCTHRASMGSLNAEQLFYLQSRGLTRWQATVAIASGFAEEVIRFVPMESVQQRWRAMVSRTIGKVKSER